MKKKKILLRHASSKKYTMEYGMIKRMKMQKILLGAAFILCLVCSAWLLPLSSAEAAVGGILEDSGRRLLEDGRRELERLNPFPVRGRGDRDDDDDDDDDDRYDRDDDDDDDDDRYDRDDDDDDDDDRYDRDDDDDDDDD